MADALLLSSARAVPRRLEETGYRFRFPELPDALRHLLAKGETP
jgi:NAD dependent epimerase/dehydratase family enzyme